MPTHDHTAHVLVFLDITQSPPVAKRAGIYSERFVTSILNREAQVEVFSITSDTYADAHARARDYIRDATYYAWLAPLMGASC
jgi:hypothetical protein